MGRILGWRADTREQGDEWEQNVQCEIRKESIKHKKEIRKSNDEEIILNYMKIFYYTTHLKISNISK